jgi:hypothetical protein
VDQTSGRRGLNAENLEIVGRRLHRWKARGSVRSVNDERRPVFQQAHFTNAGASVVQGLQERIRRHRVLLAVFLAHHLNNGNLARIRVRQRTKQDGIGHAQDRRIGPDGQHHSHDPDDSESRRVTQPPERKCNVVQEG